MSVQLQRFGDTGKSCPKCKNNSIFIDDINSRLLKIYRYTLIKCYCCDYEIMYDKRLMPKCNC